MTDKQAVDFWKAALGERIPVIQRVKGVRPVKVCSGAGALRADIRLVYDMDDSGAYEAVVPDLAVHKIPGSFHNTIDLKSSTQMFIREVTPDLLKALSS